MIRHKNIAAHPRAMLGADFRKLSESLVNIWRIKDCPACSSAGGNEVNRRTHIDALETRKAAGVHKQEAY